MNITITGATGFVGGRLTEKLLAEGHRIHALGRNRGNLPTTVRFSDWNAQEEPPAESLMNCDVLVHLAGEPVAQRWTPEVKARIRSSRIDGTRHLVDALSTQARRPNVLICASAVGYYGSRGSEVLDEESAPGDDFLARLARDWEHAAGLARALGIRVVCMRIGVVLGSGGGALTKMLSSFRLGLGGHIGSGKQWMSWIHIDDLVDMILFAIEKGTINGPLNGTAPNPVTNADFTRKLAAVLHRPAFLAVPGFGLKLLFGEMAQVILGGQRVIPKNALEAGYPFRYSELKPALAAILP